jgi:hypothetical protein
MDRLAVPAAPRLRQALSWLGLGPGLTIFQLKERVSPRLITNPIPPLSFSTMLARVLALAACALPLVSALPKIHAKGKYLYDEGGNRFYIKVCRLSMLSCMRTTAEAGSRVLHTRRQESWVPRPRQMQPTG